MRHLPKIDKSRLWAALDLSKSFGYMHEDEIIALARVCLLLPKNPVVVNIGAGSGTSAITILQSRDDVTLYSVDKEDNDSPYGGLQNERNALEEYKIKTNGRFMQIHNYSGQAGLEWEDEKVNMVFVDGDHAYGNVKFDTLSWIRNIKKNGIIAFHDYGVDTKMWNGEEWIGETWPDVKRFVDEKFSMDNCIILERSFIAFRII